MDRVVTVKFKQKFVSASNCHFTGQGYFFLTSDDSVGVDDLVVVDTQFGPELGKVVDIPNRGTDGVTKEVICKVDVTAFMARKEKARKIAELTRAAEARAREIKARLDLEKLAESDAELAGLLAALKELGS